MGLEFPGGKAPCDMDFAYFAFTLGIVPLVIAKGPSSETQNALGTGLFGGMISATVLAVLFVPVFFVLVMRFAGRTVRAGGGANQAPPLKAS